MSSLKITIVVAADPSENVHSSFKADSAEIWEVAPMLERAIADLQAELAALPSSHRPRPKSIPALSDRSKEERT